MIDFYSEFSEYATKHMGISSMQLHYWEQLQNRIYDTSASLTPYILEERPMNVTQMDIFSRLMMERTLWIAGPVNDRMSTIVQAQLMFLDSISSSEDIRFHIDSPGGSVKSGLSMIDTMNYIKSDVSTINTGMAASMGSVLLGGGTKGKRFSLKNSRVMLHQVSAGVSGTLADMKITIAETEKYNALIFDMLGSFVNKTPEQVKKDADRDFWMNAQEALEYGLIDGIIEKKK